MIEKQYLCGSEYPIQDDELREDIFCDGGVRQSGSRRCRSPAGRGFREVGESGIHAGYDYDFGRGPFSQRWTSHWMDDRTNHTKRDVVKGFFDQILSQDDNRMDPQLMADAMVSIIP